MSVSGGRNKGQLSIEFVAGFMIFIVIISFLVFAVFSIFPSHHAESKYNALREDSWALSENVMQYLVIGNSIDDARLADLDFGIAHHGNPDALDDYNDFKNLFGVDMLDEFRITVTVSPVLVTDAGTRSGDIYFDGDRYTFDINVDCDKVNLYDETYTHIGEYSETNQVNINGNLYTVERIDSSCEIVILSIEILDAGKPVSMTSESSKVIRFSNYDGFMAKVDVTYW